MLAHVIELVMSTLEHEAQQFSIAQLCLCTQLPQTFFGLCCRLLSPSRIYKQLYHATAYKTELVAACLQLLNSNSTLSINSMVHHLTQGVAMLTKQVDAEADEDLGYDAHVHAEVKQFSQHDLEDHAAFVVQQMTPILGRHALKVCPWTVTLTVTHEGESWPMYTARQDVAFQDQYCDFSQ